MKEELAAVQAAYAAKIEDYRVKLAALYTMLTGLHNDYAAAMELSQNSNDALNEAKIVVNDAERKLDTLKRDLITNSHTIENLEFAITGLEITVASFNITELRDAYSTASYIAERTREARNTNLSTKALIEDLVNYYTAKLEELTITIDTTEQAIITESGEANIEHLELLQEKSFLPGRIINEEIRLGILNDDFNFKNDASIQAASIAETALSAKNSSETIYNTALLELNYAQETFNEAEILKGVTKGHLESNIQEKDSIEEKLAAG